MGTTMTTNSVAEVYVGSKRAATLSRDAQGGITFAYTPSAIRKGGPQVASTLPVSTSPITTSSGALPTFFSNLLPEGRRLSTLKRAVKSSLDDELTMLLEVGGNTVGDVTVVSTGANATTQSSQLTLDERVDFGAVLSTAGIVDPAALPGVQDKASARTIAAPVKSATQDYILKVSPPEYPRLVENEAECFAMGKQVNPSLAVAQARVIHDVHGRSGLLVARFDRDGNERHHVEDACQLLNLYPAQKYAPALEEVADAIARVARSPKVALRSLAYMAALSWLTGNGDMHTKNISVIDRGQGFEIAPVYDIPSTLVYGDTSLALEIQGVTDNLSAKKFRSFTASIGLSSATTDRVMSDTLKATAHAADRIVAASRVDSRKARDIRRVLAYRRKLWST